MNPTGKLHEYLQRIQRRLQLTVASRGLGAVALAALVFTVVLVFIANQYAFSNRSVIGSRTLLFAAVIAVLALLLVRPLLRLGRRTAARRIEESVPAFQGRMATFLDASAHADQPGQPKNPLLDLLAEDTMRVAELAPAEHVVSWNRVLAYCGLAVVAAGSLIWLGTSGPGYWGYGTARLWGGWLQPEQSPLYQIVVSPGDATIRQGADLIVTAEMVGFESPGAQLFAKFASGVQWEEAPMQRQLEGSGFEFLFAGVREPFEYYIEAGGIRTKPFDVQVVAMPNVTNLRLTYHYPDWTGLNELVEDPGGDIRAVAGTEVEVEIETDKPLSDGVLRVNDQTIRVTSDGLHSRGRIQVEKDGQYHVGSVYSGEAVRITEDFFITVVPDDKPVVKVIRPSRDWRATNIEEVLTEFEAGDDFGLTSFDLHYSVNGGPVQTVPLQKARQSKQAQASHLFSLEELGAEGAAPSRSGTPQLVPGDVVAYYAVAKDHKLTAQTDLYFIEVQPFDRQFSQSQASGGMGGAGQEDEISKRQKLILAATWNLIQSQPDANSQREKEELRDNSWMLSETQLTLRDQAQTLAERARARQLAGTSKDFKEFVENLEKGSEFMAPAADKLKSQKLNDSLPLQQKALQHLLRAEAIFRNIQVAFGGSSGGQGGAGRDLAEMFELEMDLEKNQYETGGGASQQQIEREIDEALEKLRELARRQEKLAEQRQRQQTPTFAQRWQQETLRREAEELKRRLEELQQRQQAQQQSGQPQRGQQSGSSGSSASTSPGSSQANLESVIKRLEQATRDMQAGQAADQGQSQESPSRQAQGAANAQRAQQKLEEALKYFDEERRRQTSSSISEIAQDAEQLAEQQQQIEPQLKQALRQALEQMRRQPDSNRRRRLPSGLSPEQEQDLSQQKSDMHETLEALEQQMQETIRRLGNDQRETGGKLRKALGDLQESEVGTQLRVASEYIRRGAAPYVANGEEGVTRALERLREQTREAERLAQSEGNGPEDGLERSLARLEDLRRQLEQAAGLGQQPGPQGQQPGPGEQQGPGQQAGQQAQNGPGERPGEGQQPGQAGEGGQQGQGQGQRPGEGRAGTQPGQQPGQGQGQGQQPGGSSQPGQGQQGSSGGQPGGQQQAWGPGGAHGGPMIGGPSASNYGRGSGPSGVRAWDPETRQAIERALRESQREIPQVTRDLRAGGIHADDLEEIRKFVQGLSNSRFAGNPQLLETEYRRMLALLEQLELQVRREVELAEGAAVRTIVTEPVPEEYREAVAEYFRRLSQSPNR